MATSAERAQRRKALDVSQQRLADLLSLPQATISRIERGSDLRLSTLIEIARALGLEPMLVPQIAVPAVRALIDEATTDDSERERGRFER